MRTTATTFYPGDEPEIELIDGLPVAKMSPKRRHAVLQTTLGALVREWAIGRGTVGTEWRFHLSGTPSRKNSYVPDLAYVSAARLRALTAASAEEPPFAPDVAVEIHSPGDRERNVGRKVERYLQYGSRLVLDVRPMSRTIVAHDVNGKRVFTERDRFEHAALPGFSFAVAALFSEADLR